MRRWTGGTAAGWIVAAAGVAVAIFSCGCQEEGVFGFPFNGGGTVIVPPPTGCSAGVAGALSGARTSDGFVGQIVNSALPVPTASYSPTLSASSLTSPVGGTTALTVGAAVPITDILIGVPGQIGYLDINVNGGTAAGRQVPSVIGGYNLTLNVDTAPCLALSTLNIELKDAGGNISQASAVTVNSTPLTGSIGAAR
ncbi:MAG: hypothetical protein M3Y56_00010 [Armatimonadota bacterium]|nr:hypothetical protein [Armatimonadota bacterium]